MKPVTVGEREQADINAQVDKILRGLGIAEPPIRLEDVRELLRLDRKFYSTTDDSVLHEVISRIRVAAKQIILRPTILVDVVRKAKLSALWIPDRKRILIDGDLPKIKHRWAEAHEISHAITEWHQGFLFGDSKEELHPACLAELEAEANYGAGQLLFLRGRFAAEARDMALGLKSVKTLSDRFGNTITSTLWRYVEQTGNRRPMVALVTPHPKRLPDDHDPMSPCRYFVGSSAFVERFSALTEVELFAKVTAYCRPARGGPLGADELCLVDVNGDDHLFHFETFFNRHEALTLGYHKSLKPIRVAV